MTVRGARRPADDHVVVAGAIGALVLTIVAVVVAQSPWIAGVAAVAAVPQVLTLVAAILASRLEPGEGSLHRWGVRLLPWAVGGALVSWVGLAAVWVTSV